MSPFTYITSYFLLHTKLLAWRFVYFNGTQKLLKRIRGRVEKVWAFYKSGMCSHLYRADALLLMHQRHYILWKRSIIIKLVWEFRFICGLFPPAQSRLPFAWMRTQMHLVRSFRGGVASGLATGSIQAYLLCTKRKRR